MLTIILSLAVAAHGQFVTAAQTGSLVSPNYLTPRSGPYPPAQPVAVGPYPPVLRSAEGPYPPAQRATIGPYPPAQRAPVGPYPPAQRATVGKYPPAKLQIEGGDISPAEQDLPEKARPTAYVRPNVPLPTRYAAPVIQDSYPTGQIRNGPPSYPSYSPSGEGQKLLGNELPTPSSPGSPSKPVKFLSGGDVSPGELEVPKNTQITLQDKNLQYSHGFSDDKGTSVREQGSLLSTNGGWEYVIAKKGSYSYISPEGRAIKVNYIADHNGYRVLPE